MTTGPSNVPRQFKGTPTVLTVPSEPDKAFPMRHADWERLQRRVCSLKQTDSLVMGIAWTALGIGAGAGLAYFPWAPAYEELPQSAKLHYAYITPLLIVLCVAFFALAGVCFYLNSKTKKLIEDSIKDVVSDMDAVYRPHKQGKP